MRSRQRIRAPGACRSGWFSSGRVLAVFAAAMVLACGPSTLHAQDPAEDTFVLGFEGPDTISGPEGSQQTAQYVLTLTHEGVGPGAAAWSWGMMATAEPGTPVVLSPQSVAIAGTDAGGVLQANGFEFHEITPGGDVIGAVILSETDDTAVLPPNTTSSIAVVEMLADIPPQTPTPPVNTLRYVDGLQGSGRPVPLVVSQHHRAFTPDSRPHDVLVVPEVNFIRGDADIDGRLTINDAVLAFWHILLGRPAVHPCPDAVDSDDDGVLTMGDPLALLGDLFQGTFQVPPPLVCGPDPTADQLGCVFYSPCGANVELLVDLPSRVFVTGEQLVATFEVRTDGPFEGRLQASLAADRGEEQGIAIIGESEFNVSHAAAQSSFFDVSFDLPAAGAHILIGLVRPPEGAVEDENVLARTSLTVGVRPDDPRLASLPDEILTARLEDADVATIQAQVREAAANGEPVRLQLKQAPALLLLERSEIFEPDAEVEPELADLLPAIESYNGRIVDPQTNEPVAGSVAVLSFGLETMYGLLAPQPSEFLWIEPLSNYDPQSPPQTLVLYNGRDVLAEENDHNDPVADEDAIRQPEEPLQLAVDGVGDGGGANFAFLDINKVIRLKVYEHFVNFSRTLRRCNIIYCWRALMLNEFQNVHPRVTSFVHLDVVNVTIQSWGFLSTANYGGNCQSDLSQFRSDRSGVNRRLYVLFSHLPTGCGGIAYLGQGSRTDWHSITKDTHSFHTDVVIHGQETGHNLDWHGSWSCCWSPHDPHLDISEIWNVTHCGGSGCYTHQHCTIMRASYDGCDFAEWRYRRFSNTGLRHIAEGILRTF